MRRRSIRPCRSVMLPIYIGSVAEGGMVPAYNDIPQCLMRSRHDADYVAASNVQPIAA